MNALRRNVLIKGFITSPHQSYGKNGFLKGWMPLQFDKCLCHRVDARKNVLLHWWLSECALWVVCPNAQMIRWMPSWFGKCPHQCVQKTLMIGWTCAQEECSSTLIIVWKYLTLFFFSDGEWPWSNSPVFGAAAGLDQILMIIITLVISTQDSDHIGVISIKNQNWNVDITGSRGASWTMASPY